MINDRGMKKWTQMMLPEHRALLRELDDKKAYIPKPELDDQEKEEMEREVWLAYSNHQSIIFSYWQAGKTTTVSGQIQKLDQTGGRIKLDDDEWYRWENMVSLKCT